MTFAGRPEFFELDKFKRDIFTNHRIVGTSVLNDISDEMFLTVVSRQNGDLLSRVSDKSHVHESCDNVFSFGQVLVEIWQRSECVCEYIYIYIYIYMRVRASMCQRASVCLCVQLY